MPVLAMAADEVPMLQEEDSDQPESTDAGLLEGSRGRVRAVLSVTAIIAVAATVVSRTGAGLRFRGEATAVGRIPTFEGKSKAGRHCKDLWGVQVAEPDSKTSLWPACSPKWTEDCSKSGCCADWGMKCYGKNKGWAACKADCAKKDDKNESWTCEEITPPSEHTAEECFAQCKAKLGCKQAVFTQDGGGSCHFSTERVTEVAWAADNVNSTFCGDLAEQGEVKEASDKVDSQLPFQMEWPKVDCSWGGDDCSKTLCCNDQLCDKDFKECTPFSCYKKDQYFSGCAAAPLKGWDGEWQGGGRDHRAVPPAGSRVAVQGTSLYCFTVVTWDAPRPKPFWNSEAELANNWKTQGLHVLKCDGHEVVDGVLTPKAEWGSFSNIDMFMDVWQKIKAIGKWKNYDWTVKVDSDAVFIPSRLKDHLYNLRTPKGARVYLENVNFKFRFMGAIEIMTREAVAVFVEEGHTCIHGKHEGGEDSFLKGCLDGLGIDHQSDFLILRDKYAGLNPPCVDGWAVAYHYLKKTHDWSMCYNEVMCGESCEITPTKEKCDCDAAIPVPHEPGYLDAGVVE